jgi:hypothetical protein
MSAHRRVPCLDRLAALRLQEGGKWGGVARGPGGRVPRWNMARVLGPPPHLVRYIPRFYSTGIDPVCVSEDGAPRRAPVSVGEGLLWARGGRDCDLTGPSGRTGACSCADSGGWETCPRRGAGGADRGLAVERLRPAPASDPRHMHAGPARVPALRRRLPRAVRPPPENLQRPFAAARPVATGSESSVCPRSGAETASRAYARTATRPARGSVATIVPASAAKGLSESLPLGSASSA